MLPSYLHDPTKKNNERLSHTRLGQPPPPPMPSLCVTGAMSQIGRCEASPGVFLHYCIFRPRQLHDLQRPPLIVCHGGPSIPSNYLLPLVNGVTDRAVIFYDQYGCGKSSRPRDNKAPFSIQLMVDHLQILIKQQWGLAKYHLFGHSFGGILAFEYLAKETGPSGCESLILCSTPTSSNLIQRESKRMYQKVNGHGEGEDQDDIDEDPATRQLHAEVFRQTHECRISQTPLALLDAMAQAGPVTWRGLQAIPNYEANGRVNNIPTLLLRGEYDFCTEKCMHEWNNLIENPSPKSQTIANCSHYGMLEDEREFGNVVSNFLRDSSGAFHNL